MVVAVEKDDAQREIDERGDDGAEGTPQQWQRHHGVDNEHQEQRVPDDAAVVIQLGRVPVVELHAEADLTCHRADKGR